MPATDLSHAAEAGTRERLWAALEQLCDPEIPVLTLREMGILRDLRPAADAPEVWEVLITPTYSGCPAMDQIEDDVRATVQGLGLPVRVLRQLAPAWSTDSMSPAAREKLRAYGIAAPLPCAAAVAAGPAHEAQPLAAAGRDRDRYPSGARGRVFQLGRQRHPGR